MIEDHVVQLNPEVSPPKWHLAHSTWFWEEVILTPYSKGFMSYNDQFRPLFNSYYDSLGRHWIQADRGNLSRPTVQEVRDYRTSIDQQMRKFLGQMDVTQDIAFLIKLGIQHEEQHQELLLMDIKAILAANVIDTKYSDQHVDPAKSFPESWKTFSEGIYEIGHEGKEFAFDNEKPRHKNYMYPFEIRSTLVTNGEYLSFIEAGGYAEPKYWLSLGWDWVKANPEHHPLYWRQKNGEWSEYTLYGEILLDPHAPVVHMNYFEADAFARWAGQRLPTEQEVEIFLQASPDAEMKPSLHPTNAGAARGQVWCWTKSAYDSYPGFKPFDGALEEYNGKFMCNQMVLKSGCVVTPPHHFRDSYRNFYLPNQRWMFSGIRLARDIK